MKLWAGWLENTRSSCGPSAIDEATRMAVEQNSRPLVQTVATMSKSDLRDLLMQSGV
jgi:hypothetical protein